MKKQIVFAAVPVGFVSLVLALLLGGGAPTKSAPGLPDAGFAIGWLVPTLSMANFLIVFTMVGFSLAASFFFVDEGGALGVSATRFIRRIPSITLIWISVNALLLIVKAAYEIGIPFRQSFNFATIYSYSIQTTQGNAILWQFFIVALLMGVTALTYRVRGSVTALVLSLLIFVPPAITSHAAGAGHHGFDYSRNVARFLCAAAANPC